MTEPETYLFSESDWVPNHPMLPVLLYRHALSPQRDRADAFESISTTSIITPARMRCWASPVAKVWC